MDFLKEQEKLSEKYQKAFLLVFLIESLEKFLNNIKKSMEAFLKEFFNV